MWRAREAEASIMSPPATNTDGSGKTVSNKEQTTGGPTWDTSRKLTNTVVISARTAIGTALTPRWVGSSNKWGDAKLGSHQQGYQNPD
jgi:hypothetical protein